MFCMYMSIIPHFTLALKNHLSNKEIQMFSTYNAVTTSEMALALIRFSGFIIEAIEIKI